MTKNNNTPSAIVIGGSAGSLPVVTHILSSFQRNLSVPVIICLHRMKNAPEGISEVISNNCFGKVIEPDDKDAICNGNIYIAPSNYHLLVAHDLSFALSTDLPVNYSRPSIDVTFQTAAEVYKNNLTGILLTGANKDGAAGMCSIKKLAGRTIIQDPRECVSPFMPLSALEQNCADFVYKTERIISFLKRNY